MLNRLGDTLDPHEGMIDAHRLTGSDAADRLARFATMTAELLEMREDDRAHAMLGACINQVAVLKREFSSIGRAHLEKPAAHAKTHFQDVGSKDHQQREEHRTERLQQDAEADAASS